VGGQATIQNGHIEAVGRHGRPKFRGIVRSSDFVALGSQVVGQFVDKKSFAVEKNQSAHKWPCREIVKRCG